MVKQNAYNNSEEICNLHSALHHLWDIYSIIIYSMTLFLHCPLAISSFIHRIGYNGNSLQLTVHQNVWVV